MLKKYPKNIDWSYLSYNNTSDHDSIMEIFEKHKDQVYFNDLITKPSIFVEELIE